MKNFNYVCMIALLACGTYCTSSLHAETPEITENQNEVVDFELSTDTSEQIIQDHEAELSSIQITCNAVDEAQDIRISVDENITDDTEEISFEVFASKQINNDPAQEQAIVTQEQIVLEDEIDALVDELIQLEAVENNLDALVDELVQSGAVEDDISNLENQPRWKLLLARVGSYALSMGITCKQLITQIYTSIHTTLVNYWSNKKKA